MYLREIASGHYHQLFALAIKLHLAAYRSYIGINSPSLPTVILTLPSPASSSRMGFRNAYLIPVHTQSAPLHLSFVAAG